MVASLAEQGGNSKEAWMRYIETITNESLFSSRDKIEAFIANPDLEVLKSDELFALSTDLLNRYRMKSDEEKEWDNNFKKAYRMMIQGMREQNPKQKYYPDANSTLRLTYGKISTLPDKGNNDAAINYYTTLKGTIAKYKPGDDEFDIPEKLIQLYNEKDYGRYADKNGYLPVNFLTDHDITGGNSGSPVLNGKGELIGIAFDGNIEAMAGDVIFDPELQRAINVDIRYVLFIIDKFAGATHIIDELTISE